MCTNKRVGVFVDRCLHTTLHCTTLHYTTHTLQVITYPYLILKVVLFGLPLLVAFLPVTCVARCFVPPPVTETFSRTSCR